MRKVFVLAAIAALSWNSAAAQQTGARGAEKGRSGRATEEVSPDNPAVKVIIDNRVLEGWSFLYQFVTEVEFVLCLEGRREGNTLMVDGFRLARMEAPTANSVRYQPCEGEAYIGTAHNHPPVDGMGSLCYRSIPDRRSFEVDRRAIVDVILCGADRYIWILRDGSQGGPGREARASRQATSR